MTGHDHLTRQVAPCLTDRLPADEARIKLEVAVIAAGVLDGGAW